MRSSGPLTRFSSAAALFFSACSGAPPPEPSQIAPPPPKTPEALVCAAGSADCESQLGDGGFEDATRAVRVKGISDAVHIAAGMRHACAVRKSGRVACWGSNDMDQVGHSDPPVFLLPTPVQGLP